MINKNILNIENEISNLLEHLQKNFFLILSRQTSNLLKMLLYDRNGCLESIHSTTIEDRRFGTGEHTLIISFAALSSGNRIPFSVAMCSQFSFLHISLFARSMVWSQQCFFFINSAVLQDWLFPNLCKLFARVSVLNIARPVMARLQTSQQRTIQIADNKSTHMLEKIMWLADSPYRRLMLGCQQRENQPMSMAFVFCPQTFFCFSILSFFLRVLFLYSL